MAGYQFNFMVRSRVQREDGDEYLFDLHTVVVLPDGSIDQNSPLWLQAAIASMIRPHRKSKEPWTRSIKWTLRKPIRMPRAMLNVMPSSGIGMKMWS